MLHERHTDWASARRELLPGWEALMLECDGSPAHHPEWIEALAASTGTVEALRVFSVHESDRLVGVVPYYQADASVYGVRLRTLDLAGNLISYHHQLLASIAPGALLARFLGSAERWELFRAEGMLRPSPGADALERLREHGVLVAFDRASSPTMEFETDWESILKSKSSSFRNNVGRRRRRMDRHGEVTVRWFEEASEMSALLEAILEVESRSWKVDAGMAISERDQERRYYERLLPWLASRGWVLADVVALDGRTVAYSLCYRYNGRVGQLKTSFDNEFASLAPGTLANDLAIERACRSGAREFDFLGDVMPHKMAWATRVRAHRSYHLYANGVASRMLGLAKRAVQWARTKRRGSGPRGSSPEGEAGSSLDS